MRKTLSKQQAANTAVSLLTALLVASTAQAQTRLPTVDRFTATTVAMTPANIGLRIDVREWSDDASRAAVVAALEREAETSKALTELPTVGYVWTDASGVGYSVKYAHRVTTEAGERVTFVTDRRIGSYDYRPWTPIAGSPPAELAYSVIELELDDEGNGTGTLSLAAEVRIDPAKSLVFLEGSAAPVLENAREEPKPYWATGS